MATDSGANPAEEPEDSEGTTEPKQDLPSERDDDSPSDAEPPAPVDLDLAHDRAS